MTDNIEQNLPENGTKKFGRYQVFECVGAGSMGKVYKAYDSKLDRVVALKVLAPHLETDEIEIYHLFKEAKAVAQLKHPNIVTVFDFGHKAKRYFIAMEFINGISLKEYIKKQKPSASSSAEIMIKIAHGLHEAHKQGMIHRDIKPANIMLQGKEPKITDFGVAKLPDSSSTVTGEMVGTLTYMSPEQAKDSKNVNRCTDIYALGVLFYELLVGKPPFVGKFQEVTTKICNEIPSFPKDSEIPKELQNICLKCLEKKPKARYQSAKTFANELQSFLQQKPIASFSKSPWYLFSKWVKRNPAFFVNVVLLIGTILAGSLSSGYFYNKYQQEKKKLQKIKSSSVSLNKNKNNIYEVLKQTLFWPLSPQNTSFANTKFEKLAQKFPNSAYLYREWGSVLYKHSFYQKNNEERSIFLDSALAKFEKAQILNRKDHLSLFLSYLVSLRYPNQKMNQNRFKYLRKITHRPDVFKKSAEIILELNRDPKPSTLQKLVKKCEQTLTHFNPDFIPLYELKAKILFKLKQWPQAIACCTKALLIAPKNPYIREQRGKIYLKMKKWVQALEDFNKLINLNLRYPGGYYGKAEVWKNLKYYQQALGNANKALELGYSKEACLLLRQFLYAKLKEHKRALSDCNILARLDATNSLYFLARARIYIQMKNFVDAFKDCQTVLQIDPNNKQAKQIKNLLKELKSQNPATRNQ